MKSVTVLLLLLVALLANPAAVANPDPGFESSVEQGTQLNFGKLGIGVGSVLRGPYLDEKKIHRQGLYATLEIGVEGEPSQFRQADVHEGQTLEVAGYRILVEKIIATGKGTVILKMWAPPQTQSH